MKFNSLKLITLSVLGAFITGCTNLSVLQPTMDSTVFYYLDSPLDSVQAKTLKGDGIAVLIGPSSVAKYLDQSKIVTCSNPNQLEFSETQRWAESLQENINRVLIDHLSIGLGSSQIGFLRAMSDIDWDYRVGYHIYQLAGTPGDTVHLQVSWWVVTRDGKTNRFDGSFYEEETTGETGDYPAYVQAIEKLIEEWSNDVSAQIRRLDDGTGN